MCGMSLPHLDDMRDVQVSAGSVTWVSVSMARNRSKKLKGPLLTGDPYSNSWCGAHEMHGGHAPRRSGSWFSRGAVSELAGRSGLAANPVVHHEPGAEHHEQGGGRKTRGVHGGRGPCQADCSKHATDWMPPGFTSLLSSACAPCADSYATTFDPWPGSRGVSKSDVSILDDAVLCGFLGGVVEPVWSPETRTGTERRSASRECRCRRCRRR